MANTTTKVKATKKTTQGTTKPKKGSFEALVAAAAFAKKSGLSSTYGRE